MRETDSPSGAAGKHGIESYVSPTSPTMSSTGTDDEEGEVLRPNLVVRRVVRSQDHLNLAQTVQVESKKKSAGAIGVKNIVKIFTTDDDFIEVTPEQVDRVKTMHESIEDGVNFSFNYNTLLFVAAVLAALGVVSNSGTTVIASMLVSPIMGPVVGLAYGTTINDWKLVRLSIRNECISLVVCIVVGLIIGAITGTTALAEDWPTDEMASRASLQNFLVALPVAFFSGLGVAVSLLDQQTASLVGVAISASLLPPAVNAGIIWVFYGYVKSGIIPGEENTEWLHQGLLSLFLTIANIILIWLASMLMFRIKEVLPVNKSVFWEDLGIARKIYNKRALLEVDEVEDSPV